jgi:hypothetical protein
MYAILHARATSVSSRGIEVLGSNQYVHVLIHVERIGLLREIVRTHRTTHLGRFVLLLT